MSDRTRPSDAAAIVDAVLDALADGRLPSGTKLGEDRLSRIYGVGRRVVREALKGAEFLRRRRAAAQSRRVRRPARRHAMPRTSTPRVA